MRKLIIGCITFLCFPLLAEANIAIDPLINRVTLQLNAEQWVTTKNALVSVNIDAAVSDHSLEKINSQVLEKLAKLSNKGEWHLVSYDRSQDKSGLESVRIVAQARLLETELAGLRDKAKAISKPGETYTVDSIQFTPSDEEKQEANNALRQNIYAQVKNELTRLNNTYPEQKYYVHEINFIAEPIAYGAQTAMYKMGDNAMPARAPMSVGDKMRVNATVVLSTLPDPNLLKLLVH